MDVAFEPNNDARSEKAYTKNLPMLKIQTHETVNPEDWHGLLADTPPGMEKVFWCIGCAGMFMVNTEDKFDVWCAWWDYAPPTPVPVPEEKKLEDRVKELENQNATMADQLTSTQMALCDVYEQVLSVTSTATE